MTEEDKTHDVWVEYYRRRFFHNGTQYYAAARLLFFAGGAPVTGNLAHHTVEMLLKGALCRAVSLEVLASPKFGHSLTRLWNRFKTEMGDPSLVGFDSTIAMLDPFEDLRYPDTMEGDGFALALTIEPTPLMPITPHFSHRFRLVLRDLDALVQRILAQVSVDPVVLAMSLNAEGRAALARDNATGIWAERKT